MNHSATDEYDVPRLTPAVQWLIAINVAIYFLQLTLVRQSDLVAALAFKSPGDLTQRPWTIVTYMFVHAGFLHLAFNMWMLWLFGPRLEQAWGPRSFSFYYLLCGLGGWLADLLIVHNGTPLLGATAAIFGVMLAYAMRWPDDELRVFPLVFVAMKVRWFVVLLAAWSLIIGVMTLQPAEGTAYMAHLGGFAVGWLYLRAASVSSLDRLRQRMSQIPDVPDEPPRAIPRTHTRSRERTTEIDEIVARSNAMAAKRQSTTLTLSAKDGKQRIEQLNLVLDKISERGLASLSGDERHLLEEMSKQLRSD
ncbi:MAG TPA: rhomboid family intramembrane serine protease [Gemmatimonadaceae bacterium]|nr:rhomboid family intramembrane serine protease [Gemmatimonadaceae bacterium]